MATETPKPDDLDTKDLDDVSGGAFDSFMTLTDGGGGIGPGKLTESSGGPKPQ